MDQHARFAAIGNRARAGGDFYGISKAHSVRVSGVDDDDWGVESEITASQRQALNCLGITGSLVNSVARGLPGGRSPRSGGAAGQLAALLCPGFVEAVGAKAARCDREGRPLGYPDAMECLGRYRMKERGETGDEVAGLG